MKILPLLPALTGVIFLSMAHDFWLQLRTFAWTPVTAAVVSHTLTARTMGPSDGGTSGEVRFVINGDPRRIEYSDRIFERKFLDRSTRRTNRFIESLSPGTTHTAYQKEPGGVVSFGRFPRSYDSAIMGFGSLLLAWSIWKRRGAENKSVSGKDETPAGRSGSDDQAKSGPG